MRKEIYKELTARFQRELERRLSRFQRCGVERGAGDAPMWAWELAPSLTFFVMLNVADNADDFAIEVAWSDDGKYPWRILPPHRFYEKLDLPKCRGRLSFLWITDKREYRWAVVPKDSKEAFWAKMAAKRRGEKMDLSPKPLPVDEALPRMALLVEDAAEKLAQYGLPLFQGVAERKRINWLLPNEKPVHVVAEESSAHP